MATQSFLPIVKAFAKTAEVVLETKDISLAGRIIAAFPDYLSEEQQKSDDLKELGELAKTPEANIVKLPNISASIPQLTEAIDELQKKGYPLPDYTDEPKTDEERDIKSRYDKIKGSAVNPVLREGNSDRRAPRAVKNYAKKNPHSMGEWSSDSKTHVATMPHGDFKANEKSRTVEKATNVKIELQPNEGDAVLLKEKVALLQGEIVDATVMDKEALIAFLKEQVKDAKAKKRTVFFASKGHHDESFRPHHLRACGGGVFLTIYSESTKTHSRNWASVPATDLKIYTVN